MMFGGSKTIAHMMEKTNQEDDMPIQAGMVSKSIESAQRQVESMHFAARKNVLEYDDVMNLQRKGHLRGAQRHPGRQVHDDRIPGIIRQTRWTPSGSAARQPSDDWDARAIDLWAANMTGCNDFSVAKVDHEDEAENVAEALNDFLTWIYEQKSEQLGPRPHGEPSAQVMLRIIDTRWMAHLQEMDYLKMVSVCALRPSATRSWNTKNEAYNAFQNLTSRCTTTTAHAVAPGDCREARGGGRPRRCRPGGPGCWRRAGCNRWPAR